MAEITEAKIRQAIWMLKAKKTKKAVCEHLGIAYNTKRLDQIIKDFHEKLEREAELKKESSQQDIHYHRKTKHCRLLPCWRNSISFS